LAAEMARLAPRQRADRDAEQAEAVQQGAGMALQLARDHACGFADAARHYAAAPRRERHEIEPQRRQAVTLAADLRRDRDPVARVAGPLREVKEMRDEEPVDIGEIDDFHGTPCGEDGCAVTNRCRRV